MPRLLLPLIAALIVTGPAWAATRPYKRPYKYYLDVRHAEEILAGITIRPQLVDEEWLNIIGQLKDDKYTVRRGDTLWGISRRQFGNARLWRKLWEVNAFLRNPHDLTIGQILQYYREGDRLAAGGLQIPVIKLVPGGRRGFDLDNDEFYQKDLRNRFQPTVMILREQDILGEVTGSYSPGEWLHAEDELFVNFYVNSTVRKNDRYTLMRYDRLLVDSTQKSRPVLGLVMRLVGEIRVIEFGENLVRVELTGQARQVQRGDLIVPLQKPVEVGAYFNPPPELQPRVVAGEEPDRLSFGQNELVLLNRGRTDGMRDGLLFRVFRDRDPSNGRRDGVEPDSKAEIQVIHTADDSSVGLVTRSELPVDLGDTLVPVQSFPDPEPPPSRPAITLEID